MSDATGRYRGKKEYFLVHHELTTAARYRGTVLYTSVAHILGIHQPGNHMAKEVGYILGEISEDEIQNGRPMLSALAVSTSGQPGSGFWTLANQLGKLTDDSSAGKEKFLTDTRNALYETWQAPSH